MVPPGEGDFGLGTQVRKSPYFEATLRWGAKAFSVYNHMYIPRDFGDPQQNFWNLVTNAILCDVAVQRQVEITGADAAKFTQMLTPRNLSACAVGQCKYVLITNSEGGILNDPVLLRLGENHFWLSLADNDVLLWAQGVLVHSGMNVRISEPDVSPLQLQGPRSGEIMKALFGEEIADLRYYWSRELAFDGIRVFTWNRNERRHETSLRLRNLRGAYPLELTDSTPQGFRFHVLDEDGTPQPREFVMRGTIPREVPAGTSP